MEEKLPFNDFLIKMQEKTNSLSISRKSDNGCYAARSIIADLKERYIQEYEIPEENYSANIFISEIDHLSREQQWACSQTSYKEKDELFTNLKMELGIFLIRFIKVPKDVSDTPSE